MRGVKHHGNCPREIGLLNERLCVLVVAICSPHPALSQSVDLPSKPQLSHRTFGPDIGDPERQSSLRNEAEAPPLQD